MTGLTAGRGWEYAYKKALEEELARDLLQLEMGGDVSTEFLRGSIHGIRVAIRELSEARTKHRQDGDADFGE